jgi:hypothetical protein
VEQKPVPPSQGSLTVLDQSPRGSRPGLFCPALSGPRATSHPREVVLETISTDRTCLPQKEVAHRNRGLKGRHI